MKLTSSLSEDLDLQRESQKSEREFKPEDLDINWVNGPMLGISDMQLNHHLALQEQVRALESESEADC